MDKNDIIEYVMHTPHNTNKAVLSSMLNQLTESGSGSSSDFSGAEVTLVNSPRFSGVFHIVKHLTIWQAFKYYHL